MSLTEAERRTLRTIADYQFGRSAGAALFPSDEAPEITRSTAGRPRQVRDDTGRLVTLGRDGRFTLGYAGGRRLDAELDPPAYRVAVGDESIPFVRDGQNAFAKFVKTVDPAVRSVDEVLVVHHETGDLLGVGRAELPAKAMRDFDRGMAVAVREGANEWAE